MKALIGYTGFVGNNLLEQTTFDEQYNSKNIDSISGKHFDTIICAGAPAVKWYANKFPEEDYASVSKLINNLKNVTCDTFILISTVDVYKEPLNITEQTPIDAAELHTYGKNRLMLEKFVSDHFPKAHILRLPGLFGTGLKKNIIFDFMNNNNIDQIESRNVFQFYNLERLYSDIQITVENNIPTVNVSTEPVSVEEIAKIAFNLDFENHLAAPTVKYDMQSIHASLYGGENGYFQSKSEVLNSIREFILANGGN